MNGACRLKPAGRPLARKRRSGASTGPTLRVSLDCGSIRGKLCVRCRTLPNTQANGRTRFLAGAPGAPRTWGARVACRLRSRSGAASGTGATFVNPGLVRNGGGTGRNLAFAGGTLQIDVTGLAAHDVLNVAGSAFGAAALAGTLQLSGFGACSRAVGDEITILRAAGAISGSFDQVVLSGFATGAFGVACAINPGTADDCVRLPVAPAVTAVAEQETWVLLAAGLGGLVFVARRRRTR